MIDKIKKFLQRNRSINTRQSLEHSGTLHWFHWFVVSLSFLLTFGAWYIAKNQVEEKTKLRFDREADQVKKLVLERMQKYEDGLWAGVAFIRNSGGDVDHNKWASYAKTISIEQKYPGINGMGVIHSVSQRRLPSYLAEQRKQRPAYKIHPKHKEDEYVPISYITPVKGNEKAVGLDMAHEVNRYTSVKKARDTGEAKITGPITLVQDKAKTPGFLFYTPFYGKGTYSNKKDRQKNFVGVVYASFIVKKLMDGVLAKESRHVNIKISDDEFVLYDEHQPDGLDFDPNPLFQKISKLPFYGRTWEFDIWSCKSFRAAADNNQPLTILFGGIFIDLLLLTLFIVLSRASRRAIGYADEMNHDLIQNKKKLETANEEIIQFNYRTSHDLVAPLKTTKGNLKCLREDIEDEDYTEAAKWITKSEKQIVKLENLIEDSLELAKADQLSDRTENINLTEIIDDIIDKNDFQIKENKIVIEKHLNHIPPLVSIKARITQILENLITNGIKYFDDKKDQRVIVIMASNFNDDKLIITVWDNGIGIPKQEKTKIFKMFYRVTSGISYGSGLGLYLTKRHVDYLQGAIEVSSDDETEFKITLPKFFKK